ncbi:MAG: glutamate--tRNA ligase [Eubacteriales bacterium]
MDYKLLSELLFPNVTLTPEELEEKYPPRNLPEGAKVTRFAPSPTGYVHLGGVYQTMVGERLAHQSGGVFYLRIEDTDSKREIPGAAENLIKTLAHYGINFDEGATVDENGKVVDNGAYGPYKQSERAQIYHVYAKKLVAEGKAYPCFTTDEELAALEAVDKKAEVKAKEWTDDANAEQKAAMLKMREFTIEDVKKNLEAGNKFVLRILSDGDPDKKTPFTDLVKGKLEIPENDEDFVLLKSDGIPTYHFAHAVDDHLMRTTHVIRGEEWLPSVAKHIMLFRYLGFKLPKYLHTAQIMQLDENGNKKKLSKRDLGANMSDYSRLGYAPEAVAEYLLTVLNSNFEEWRLGNADKPYTDFKFNINKMSVSGCLFDIVKLSDVAKNVVSKMTADKVYALLVEWAREYDADFAEKLEADPEYAKAILSIGRGGKKPRKDFGRWDEVKPFINFFYDDYYTVVDSIPDNFDKSTVNAALIKFAETLDMNDDATAWFEKIKVIAAELGFATDMKAYKADPASYKGSVADISMFIRVAITGKINAPDLYTVIHIIGRDRIVARVTAFANNL